MLVSRVQPVIVRRAIFWVVWSLEMLVLDIIGDQIVLAYSRMGRAIVLYVVLSVSFDLPQ